MADNGAFVTFGRWEEAHRALADRVGRVEQQLARLADDRSTAAQSRRNRAMTIGLGLMTGVVCPLLVTSLIAWLHLRATG